MVTANKALIAAYLPELQAALAENPSVRYVFCGNALNSIKKSLQILKGVYLDCKVI